MDFGSWCARWLRRNGIIPETLWAEGLRPLPYLESLPPADQARLRALAMRFLRRKTFEGAAGLVVTDRMRLQIAVQACLLILNLELDYYAGWSSIILYPADFRVTKEFVDDTGIVHQWNEELAGESWEQGPVILSWDTISDSDEHMNPVLHEFAHKLDMRNGAADGCPPLPPGISPREWMRDFRAAYQNLHAAIDRGASLHIDAYAAESPAEFFAVASEMFFLRPLELAADFPAVYRQLRAFYRQDPASVLQPS